MRRLAPNVVRWIQGLETQQAPLAGDFLPGDAVPATLLPVFRRQMREQMPVLAEYLLPLCKVGGRCVALKGESAVAETQQAEQAVRILGGRLALRQYHSGQLGRESEAIDMARFGAIDITRVYSGALNNAFPLTQALCLPYVFDSVAHLRRAIDGGVGEAVLRAEYVFVNGKAYGLRSSPA